MSELSILDILSGKDPTANEPFRAAFYADSGQHAKIREYATDLGIRTTEMYRRAIQHWLRKRPKNRKWTTRKLFGDNRIQMEVPLAPKDSRRIDAHITDHPGCTMAACIRGAVDQLIEEWES